MPAASDVEHRLNAVFAEKPCWMIAALSEELHFSIPSVRRFLAQTGYFSSFTHNGRWYTLSRIPRFGRDGLWFYQDIGFSRAGSLTRTLIELIRTSPQGMSAEQLGEKLRCRCHSVLVHLCREEKLQRQKLGRAYVYLSADAKTASAQLRAMKKPPAFRLPAEIAVLVLAEFIRNPDADFKKLAKTIAQRSGLRIESAQIQALFERHGLKKTAEIAVRKH